VSLTPTHADADSGRDAPPATCPTPRRAPRLDRRRSLLALVGVFDVAGTIASGWLTDRYDPRVLVLVYYLGRGLSLLALPSLLAPHTEPSTWVFILFYGLDWVATVPPTVALCRRYFSTTAPVIFGWVFAAHQLGAALAASGAGYIRDVEGSNNLAFDIAAGLCAVAAGLCIAAGGRTRATTPSP